MILATNADNLSATGRRSTSTEEELVAFITRLEFEAMLKKEKEKASTSLIGLGLKPLYPVEIASKPPIKYVAPEFQNFDGKRGNTGEHVALFLDSMGAHSSDKNLCLREFSKSPIDYGYTWYVNLKPGPVHE